VFERVGRNEYRPAREALTMKEGKE
jgi:hypothetical protein